MKKLSASILTLGLMFVCGALIELNAQGQGGGRPAGAGPPAGAGQPRGGGNVGMPAGNPGVDRGLGTASDRSGGRSDVGLGRASTNSGGRSDAGLDRARLARQNSERVGDTELNRYRGLSQRFGTTPEEMRAAYHNALLLNPDLKFGHFVSAHVVADNLGTRFPSVTANAILAGYENGDSLGRTLRNLGLEKDQTRAAEKNANERMRDARRKN